MTDLRHATFARYKNHAVVILAYGPETTRCRWMNSNAKFEFDAPTADLTEYVSEPAPALTREQETAAFFAEFRLYEHDAQRRIAAGKTI